MLHSKGNSTSAPLRVRTRALVVLGLVAALSVVAGTNAQPASARIDTLYLERMLKTVPKSAAGVGTVVGGGLTAGGLAATAATAVAGYFVFDASFDATTAALEWAFNEDHVYETDIPGGSVASGGCFVTWPNNSTLPVGCSDAGAVQGDTGTYVYNGNTYTMTVTANVTYGGSGTATITASGPVTGPNVTPLCRSTSGVGSPGNTSANVPRVYSGTTYTSLSVNVPSGSCTAPLTTVGWMVTGSTNNLLYFTPGYTTQSTPPQPAPSHRWRTTVQCPSGPITAYGETTWKQADATIPPIVPPTCPNGEFPTGMTVHEGNADGSGGTQRVDWTADPAQPFAQCLPGGAQHPCALSLYKVTAAGPKDCVGETIDCTSYDPETSTDVDYICHWGTYTAPLDDCAPLVQAITGPSPGDPLDPTDPVPGTIGAGTTVNNPDGSTTHTQTQTMPDGTTRTVTTTTYPDGSRTITTQPTNPDGTPNGAASVVNIPAPGTGSEPGTEGETAGCMGSWTWNPVAWVYRPIKCALQWAFVPRTSVMTAATDNVTGSWSGTAPAVVMDAVGDLAAPATSLQDDPELDCLGPGFTFHIWDDPWTMHPFSACGAFAAWVSSVTLPIETFLVWFAALFVGARLVMRTVGMDTPDSGAA